MIAFLLALVLLCGALAAFTLVSTRRIEARYPPSGALVHVGDGRVHVLDRPAQGKERGAVLLIHGASGNAADMSAALAGPLAEAGFRTLSVDRPGHGWSERASGGLGSWPAEQAQAIRRAAEALGVSKAIVVAHSLGAIPALALALDHVDFVRALVLIAPVSHPWPGGVAWYYTLGANRLLGPPFRRLVALPAGMALMRAAVASVFTPNVPPADFIAETRLPLVLRPMHFRANCEDVAQAKAAVIALAPRYPDIRAPTAIVTGDADSVVSPAIHSQGSARDIEGATLTVLKGVGHSPHHAAPERVVAVILEAARRADARETTQAAGAV